MSPSTDNELASTDTKIRKTIKQKIQDHGKSRRSLEPVEEADMAVEVTCAEALQQLCLTQANITIAVDPAKCCTVNLIAPADVGKPNVVQGATDIVKLNTLTKRVNLVKGRGLFWPLCIAYDDDNDKIYCFDERITSY